MCQSAAQEMLKLYVCLPENCVCLLLLFLAPSGQQLAACLGICREACSATCCTISGMRETVGFLAPAW